MNFYAGKLLVSSTSVAISATEFNSQGVTVPTPAKPLYPHFTQFPDVIVDLWMAHLNGSEFKILAYLVRHTYGWRKAADRITLEQFCAGMSRADGEVVDLGTGISRRQTINSLWVLVQAGLVSREGEPGQAPLYAIVLTADDIGLGERLQGARERLAKKAGGESDGGAETARVGGAETSPTTYMVQESSHGASTSSASTTDKDKPPVSSTQAESLCPEESACLAERQTSTPHARAKDEDSQNRQADDDCKLHSELISMGFAESQADTAMRIARKNGRPNTWVREWLDRASREGRKPDCYAYRMIQSNKELPSTDSTPRPESDGDPYSRTVSLARAAEIDSRAEAEAERTRRQVREINDGRKMTPEEREQLHTLMAELQSGMTPAAPPVRVYPTMSDEDRETMARVKAELRDRRVSA
jgi:hypothetical protein